MKQAYEQLEEEFGKWTGCPNMVACSSGTAALHLALESLKAVYGWKDGAEVLVPDFTMAACARAVVMTNLTPVFVDCCDDLLMNCKLLTGEIIDRSKVLMAVSIYGRKFSHSCLDEYLSYGGYVIEDLAEAHAVKPHKDTSAVCWSFYQNKIVAGEEGGAVAFSDSMTMSTAKCLRSLGFRPNQDYWHVPRGHNYRLANCLASKVLDSLHLYSKNKIDRDLLWKEYAAQDFGPRCSSRGEPDAKWVYDLKVDGMMWGDQDRIVAALKGAGIAARHGFKPMHMQPEFKHCKYVGSGNSVKCSQETLYLPLTPGKVTSGQIEQAASIIKSMTSV